MKTATLDPFRGYANAIRDELEDATAVLDAFHVVRLGLQGDGRDPPPGPAEQLGHRGRKHDPLYRIRNALRAGADKLTARQIERIEAGLQAGDPHFEVTIAWRCYQQLRSAFHRRPRRGPQHRHLDRRVVPHLPDPRDRPLGRTLRAWRPSSWPTSPPAEPATAAPKPSTASSNSTAAIARGFRLVCDASPLPNPALSSASSPFSVLSHLASPTPPQQPYEHA